MHASRGDRKPCSVETCQGVMQFGRSSDNAAKRPVDARSIPGVIMNPNDPMGWICSLDAAHFHAPVSVS